VRAHIKLVNREDIDAEGTSPHRTSIHFQGHASPYVSVFQPFCCRGTFRKCLLCSWSPMQWSMCHYFAYRPSI